MVNDGTESAGEREASNKASFVNPPKEQKAAIIEALMELAGERVWEDISISDIATRANVSLSAFREFFASKGAILASFARNIDKIVLDGTNEDLIGEPVKERLFDVLMRRLDALAPYKLGVEGIMEWAKHDPLAAAALNRLSVNSMRFMLEAAGIESEGPVGAIKLQGLTLAWARIVPIWLKDEDSGYASTMTALDKELTQGGKIISRVEDVQRLVAPLFSIARAFIERRQVRGGSVSPEAKESV